MGVSSASHSRFILTDRPEVGPCLEAHRRPAQALAMRGGLRHLVGMEDLIIIDPAVCNGRPVVKGTRITVQTIMEFLVAG